LWGLEPPMQHVCIRPCRSGWFPIQCSFQKDVAFPLPIFFLIALSNQSESFSIRQISLHHNEPVLVMSSSPSFLFPITWIPYLATTTSFHNSCSRDNNFHFHLARRLIFTKRRLRTPNPNHLPFLAYTLHPTWPSKFY
jgi:hypothetical protein